MSERKRILVTGATDGIGRETARILAADGHEVLVHGRSEEKCARVVDELMQTHADARLATTVCDLASLDAVRSWGETLRDGPSSLDVIVHNAGVWLNERTQTVDGFETTWAVNHLAPFLLTSLLLERLLERPGSRVINVSSMGHRSGRIAFDDPNLTRHFSALTAYCQSKLANVLFTQELARRTAKTDLVTYALHPGVIQTKLLNATGFGAQPSESPAAGARTSVFLATDPSVATGSGRYFVDCRERSPSTTDPELGRRLWELSEHACGTGRWPTGLDT